MWRPNDWGKISKEAINKIVEIQGLYHPDDFEAGADAMLEAIREGGHIRGVSLRNVKDAIGWAGIDPNSRWYCIPEEQMLPTLPKPITEPSDWYVPNGG